MAYITYFYNAKGRQGERGTCYLESDIRLGFKVYYLGGYKPFQIKRNGEVIATIATRMIDANKMFIQRVKISRFYSGWMLNNDKNSVVSFKSWKLMMNNTVIGEINVGGNIFNTLFTLITKGKFNWPDPCARIEFDNNLISAEAAISILLAESCCMDT